MTLNIQTYTIAQALGAKGSNLLVVDTGANIVAALPNPLLTARVASFTLSGPTMLTAAQMTLLIPIAPKLHAATGFLELTGANSFNVAQLSTFATLPGFAVAAGGSIALSDTTAHIVALLIGHLGEFVPVSAIRIQLDGTSMGAYPASLLSGMAAHKTLVFVASGANTVLNIAAAAHDLASNAPALTALEAHQALSFTVLNDGSAISATDAASLTTLLGFNPAIHTLYVSDTGANLTTRIAALLGHGFVQIQVASGTLSGTAAQLLDNTVHFLAGAHAQLAANANVAVSIATYLAALPGLTNAAGVSLSVTDTAANLAANPAAWIAAAQIATLSTDASVNASTFGVLIGLPHFSSGGHVLSVGDTAADLLSIGTTLLQQFGAAVHVMDTAANLAANAATNLLQTATSVSLSANAQVSATSAAQIATIPHLSPNAFQLTVFDTASAIAAHESAIAQLAITSVVTDSGPINAVVADQLAQLSAAGKLSFQGGNQLVVQDSFTALTAAGNSAGIALAARIGVLDTAANLAVASGHNWGALNPSYALSQGGTIAASLATSLADLGSHYTANGFILVVIDTAAAIVGASTSIGALGVTASVSDTAADIGAQASSLANLGAALTAIHTTDVSSVTAAVASGLASLASLLSGPALAVSDTAAHVEASLSSLHTLAGHVAVTIIDGAAAVAPNAIDLATLGPALVVMLTDTEAVDAGTAASLVALKTNFVPGTHLAITDTGFNLAARSANLVVLSADLGAITLSDGTTQTAAIAAALVPLDSHLAANTILTVTGNAAAIAANQVALATLNIDGHLAAVIVSNTTVADAAAHVAVLNSFPGQVSISDTAANVDEGLSSLVQLSNLQTIALTDSGTPSLSMTIATLAAEASTLAKIITSYMVTISDTATTISADLALGASSVIVMHAGQVSRIVALDNQPVILTQAQVLTLGIDDGPNASLAHYTGNLSVTGVDTQHLSQVASLTHAPTNISITDACVALSADLALGSTSVILANLGTLTRIDVNPGTGSALSLTVTQALYTGVDDTAHSAIGLLHGATLSVTAATVAQLPQLAALYVQPMVSVSDTAANLSTDLGSGNSALITDLSLVGAIAISDGLAISLTEAQVLAAHVDDGPGSVLSKVSGGHLAVSGVSASDLALMLSLNVAPGSLAVNDTAAHILSNLANLVADLPTISSITVINGPLALTAAEALSPQIDDAPFSLIDKLVGNAFIVTGASVAQLPLLIALGHAPAAIAVSDSSNNIVADLTSGHSVLAANLATVSTITVSHGTLTLTDANADTILASSLLNAVIGHLNPGTTMSITGVPVSDLSHIAASGWPHLATAVVDSVAVIAADLSSGSSVLQANASACASVTLDTGGSVSTATLTGMAGLPHFSTGGFTLVLQDSAAATLALGTTPLSFASSVHVIDNTANVAGDLDALQQHFGGALTITLTNSSPVITITAAQYVSDIATIDAVTNPGVFTVTGSAATLAGLAPNLSSDTAVVDVAVTDTAANVIANLAALQTTGVKLHVSLSDVSITANFVEPLLSLSNLTLGLPVVDTGSQIAAVVEGGDAAATAYLNAHGASLSSNSAIGASDAVALESLTNFTKAGHTLVVWDTAAHLAMPAYAAALAASMIDNVYLKTSGGSVTVAAATAAALFAINHFSTSNPPGGGTNLLAVADTAAHIDASLTALTAHVGQIASITMNASATISDQVLSDLQGLSALAGLNTTLTVQDTAATIAAHAVAQSTNQTILPTAWTLSASGSVTEAAAATLGALSNFNSGPYTISLGLTADTTISISDANKLGALAGALNLGGYHLLVGGTAVQLAALSPSALLVATPKLADSITNIAALSLSSPLLQGYVEVTGTDATSATTIATLLSFVHTGAGAGINAAHLTFDNTHAVQDTVANMRSLISGAAWTGNTSLHSTFLLAAQDTVAYLIDPANTALLSTLSSTQLPGSATMNAATAETLSGLASTIHFNHAGNIITVSDSAAHLVNTANAGGVAFADVIQLAGPDYLDAKDAETLLGLPHFNLNVALTITDSSINLLDGTLSSAIASSGFGSHITVQLAGPETLDAQTAETLVTVPSFADAHNLTIADDPAYLLNTANLSAEQMAVQVILASDENVSANTVLRLSEVPHFTPGSSHLVLAGSDFADAATLKAVADMGNAFQNNGHSLTMTADALSLSPTEYLALQSDGIIQNGHVMGVLPTGVTVADTNGVLTISGSGASTGTIRIYGNDGSPISTNTHSVAGFTVTAPDIGTGHNFSVTETAGGPGGEGAPIVVLDTGLVETAVTVGGGSFASTGAIQIDAGKFVDLYEAGAVPVLSHAALVYDPTAHTLTLDVPGSAPTLLVTLGGSTHPTSLSAAEIFLKLHG